jgi:hypothetical protein
MYNLKALARDSLARAFAFPLKNHRCAFITSLTWLAALRRKKNAEGGKVVQ